MRKNYFLLLVIIPVLLIPVYAQESDYTIPSWIKSVALAWANDLITDSEYQEAMKFLIEQNIIVVDSSNVVSSQDVGPFGKTNELAQKKYDDMVTHLTKQNLFVKEEYDKRQENYERGYEALKTTLDNERKHEVKLAKIHDAQIKELQNKIAELNDKLASTK